MHDGVKDKSHRNTKNLVKVSLLKSFRSGGCGEAYFITEGHFSVAVYSYYAKWSVLPSIFLSYFPFNVFSTEKQVKGNVFTLECWMLKGFPFFFWQKYILYAKIDLLLTHIYTVCTCIRISYIYVELWNS